VSFSSTKVISTGRWFKRREILSGERETVHGSTSSLRVVPLQDSYSVFCAGY
jgi:hypothetical protein